MTFQSIKWAFPVLALALAACGAVATPEWAADVQETRVAQAATADYLTSIAPTATATPSPTASATPTASPTVIPPTETTAPTSTPEATEAPTEEAAAEAEDPLALALAAGDPANGQAIFGMFYSLPDGSSWACSSCHSITPNEVVQIGPGLWNVSVRGAERVEGQNAVEYIHNSILHPADYIAPLPEGQAIWALNMPLGWGEVLSEQDLNDVIAYLVTLREE
jgi:cytochrome c2